MKVLAKFTTSKGNKIEIYKTPNGCVVSDRSCQLERTYILGQETYLNWEQLESGYKKVRTISQVINAWKNEEIHF
tara:strand:- start:416 stop:640 length:225 start_codon:yes stop_codon:yes gene_type:complete